MMIERDLTSPDTGNWYGKVKKRLARVPFRFRTTAKVLIGAFRGHIPWSKDIVRSQWSTEEITLFHALSK